MSSFNLNHILLVFAGFIVYGSLYPFDFTLTPRDADVLDALYHIDIDPPRWGDLISNVLLFIPFGFLGMAAASASSHCARQVAIIVLAGTGLAFGLQGAQIYLPTRFPSLIDSLCNILGIFLGGLLFLPLQAIAWPLMPTYTRTEHIAYVLLGAWLLDNLWPLFPALDMQTLKEGAEPLLMHPPASYFQVVMTAISWMLMIHLWEFVQKRPIRLTYQIVAVLTLIGMKILMEATALEWEEILGTLLALLMWNFWISKYRRRREVLAGLLITVLMWKGLSPFVWRDTPVSFHWMPFAISILGEPLYQMSVMIQKCFLYGCLAWLLVERGTRLVWALILSVGTLMCLETAQRYVVGHTPEITDPFLAFLLVLYIKNGFQHHHTAESPSSGHHAHSTLPQPSLTS